LAILHWVEQEAEGQVSRELWIQSLGFEVPDVTYVRATVEKSLLNRWMSFGLLLLLVVSQFYLHHLIRWQMRRGTYALVRLQRFVLAGALPEVERLSSELLGHPHCPPSTRSAALRCRAWGRICTGRLTEARNDVAQALEWNPRDGRAYLVQAMATWQTNPESALDSLNLAEVRRGWLGNREFRRALRKFRGLALSRLERWEEAVGELESGVLSEDHFTQRYLGRALAMCGRYQEALLRLEAAGEASPRYALGVFLLASGRAQDSLFWLYRAREEKPKSQTLLLEAQAFHQLGDPVGADRCLENWRSILQRPADFVVYPEITEFGSIHLAGRRDLGRVPGN
jgi:tetratricopeptide (TPR) repeat protein